MRTGKGLSLKKPLHITYSVIILGDYVSIWANARIEGVTLYENVRYNPTIELGNNVSIQQNIHMTCGENIRVGDYTAIAANVTITDIIHPYEDISIPVERQKIKTYPVFIGPHSKIYNNAVILPGTYLGRHCVVGANSVVSGVFPDFCIIVGAPARIVKRYCEMEEIWKKTDVDGNFI